MYSVDIWRVCDRLHKQDKEEQYVFAMLEEFSFLCCHLFDNSFVKANSDKFM